MTRLGRARPVPCGLEHEVDTIVASQVLADNGAMGTKGKGDGI